MPQATVENPQTSEPHLTLDKGTQDTRLTLDRLRPVLEYQVIAFRQIVVERPRIEHGEILLREGCTSYCATGVSARSILSCRAAFTICAAGDIPKYR